MDLCSGKLSVVSFFMMRNLVKLSPLSALLSSIIRLNIRLFLFDSAQLVGIVGVEYIGKPLPRPRSQRSLLPAVLCTAEFW